MPTWHSNNFHSICLALAYRGRAVLFSCVLVIWLGSVCLSILSIRLWSARFASLFSRISHSYIIEHAKCFVRLIKVFMVPLNCHSLYIKYKLRKFIIWVNCLLLRPLRCSPVRMHIVNVVIIAEFFYSLFSRFFF